MINPGKCTSQILRLIDIKRSFGEMFDQCRADWRAKATAPAKDILFAELAHLYDTLNALDRLLLTWLLAQATPACETALNI